MATPFRRTEQIARHFSPTIMSGPAVSPAPWRSALVSHFAAMDSPTFVLSTLHSQPMTDTTPSGHLGPEAATYLPRARTVVYRGMWAGLSENPRNPAPRNPIAYQTDLLTITTDARMEKVTEMFGGSDAVDASGALQSHIGGPVECVLWAAKANTQWRIRGRVHMVGPDIETAAALPVRQAILAYMRRQRTGNTEADSEAAAWSWTTELTAHFGNLSPTMRGSFRNPPPGTPVSQTPGPGLGLGQKVVDLHDTTARKYFRVIVIIPEEVDQVDLSDPEHGRRWRHELNLDDNNYWKTTELWP